MDDFILMPDDKTMERLAAEYGKIKAKTFAADKVSALSARPRYKLKKKSFDADGCRPDLDKLTALYMEGIVLIRRLSKFTADEITREGLYALSGNKRQSLEILSKCNLYGQNTIKCCAYPKFSGYAAVKRAAVNNTLDTVRLLSKLRRECLLTPYGNTFANLLEREYVNCLTLTILLN